MREAAVAPIDTMFSVSSPAFSSGGPIPGEHATERAGGRNVSIPLEWGQPPEGTASLAIETVDLDANLWIHWLVVDIPPGVTGLPAGASGAGMPKGARELTNTFGKTGWSGPQPPAGVHEYRSTVYALDVDTLGLDDDATLADFNEAIKGHVVRSSSVSGIFERR